jgi:hypothetical protein
MQHRPTLTNSHLASIPIVDSSSSIVFLMEAKSLEQNKQGLVSIDDPAEVQAGLDGLLTLNGSDPNSTGGITSTPKANGDPSGDDLMGVLRQVDNFYRQAREAIAGYLATAQKAKPNPNASNSSPKRISDSRKPGPSGDLLSVTRRQHLEYLQRERQKAEEELLIQKQINSERKKALNAQMELNEVRKETLFSGSKS